ncbi:MAG TPA: c-type cytochrome [Candidatus Sulfotelmatobacter sp.]|nr:c-type cytochrome [Candidatus Sulfotelmatobacter sp.]
MGKFVVGLIIGLAIIPICAYFYFSTGMAPVATAATPMPFEKKFANMALHARVDQEAPKTVPITADEAAYSAGAQIYKEHCAVCHGVPGTQQTAIAQGMFPKPPKLMEGKGVTDDPPGETYFKVSGGIRMTGMPAFDKTLSTTQMWQVSLLCANADKISPAVKQILTAPPAPSAVTAAETNKK